MQLVLS